MEKNNKQDPKHVARARRITEKTGYSKRYIDRVIIQGDRTNEVIMTMYMEILEDELKTDNRLLDVVKDIVPLRTTKNPKRA